jgi:hypothetical protein
MDKMNLDFLRSESGEAVQEVAMEAAQSQDVPETPTETVEMPEGEIQFELGDMEQDFGFGEPEKDPENFMQAQEERNPSEPSSRSKDTSTGREKSEQMERPERTEGQEKPSVRAELDQIRQEKQESAKQKEQNRSRSRNRPADRKKRKKSKAKGR